MKHYSEDVYRAALTHLEYIESSSPIKSVDRVRQAVRHVEEFSCSLADCVERRDERVFSWSNTVMLRGVALQPLTMPRREAQGIHLSQGSHSFVATMFCFI